MEEVQRGGLALREEFVATAQSVEVRLERLVPAVERLYLYC